MIVLEINVNENQLVEAGAVLASLDRRDLDVALARAQADQAEAEASVAAAEAGVPVTSATSEAGLRPLKRDEATPSRELLSRNDKSRPRAPS